MKLVGAVLLSGTVFGALTEFFRMGSSPVMFFFGTFLGSKWSWFLAGVAASFFARRIGWRAMACFGFLVAAVLGYYAYRLIDQALGNPYAAVGDISLAVYWIVISLALTPIAVGIGWLLTKSGWWRVAGGAAGAAIVWFLALPSTLEPGKLSDPQILAAWLANVLICVVVGMALAVLLAPQILGVSRAPRASSQ